MNGILDAGLSGVEHQASSIGYLYIILGLTLLIVVLAGTWVISHRGKRKTISDQRPMSKGSSFVLRRSSFHGNRHRASSTRSARSVQNIRNPIGKDSDTEPPATVQKETSKLSKSSHGLDDLAGANSPFKTPRASRGRSSLDGEPSTFAFQVAKALVKQLELEAEEAKQAAEAAREELDTVKVAEAKADAKLELAVTTGKEARQSVQRKQERIQELLSRSEKAKQAAEEARKELDAIGIAEAEAMAELDIALAARERINSDIETAKLRIQQLQADAKEVREEAENKSIAVEKEEAEAEVAAREAVDELYSVRKREALAMAELKAAYEEEERAKQTTEEVRKHVNHLEAAVEAAKTAATEAMQELRNARVREARLSAEISAFGAEEDEAISLAEDLNVRVQELQEKRMRSNEEADDMTIEASLEPARTRAVSAELGTQQAGTERSGWEAMKDENPSHFPESMGDDDPDERAQPGEAAIAAG